MIMLTRTKRIDWPRIVENLQRCGMSLAAIAEAVDVSKTQLLAYADHEGATEPAFWVGSSLLVLWCEKTGLKWTDAPTRTVPESVSRVLRETA